MSEMNTDGEGPTKGAFSPVGLPVSRRYVYPINRNRIWWIGLGLAGVAALTFLVDLAVRNGNLVTNGPLSSSHAAIGDNCVACHTPFGDVSSQKCSLCHERSTDVLGAYTFDAHYVHVSGDLFQAQTESCDAGDTIRNP